MDLGRGRDRGRGEVRAGRDGGISPSSTWLDKDTIPPYQFTPPPPIPFQFRPQSIDMSYFPLFSAANPQNIKITWKGSREMYNGIFGF